MKTINFKDNFILVRDENDERYRVEIQHYRTLERTELCELVTLAQNGDVTATNKVVTANLKIVWSIAKRYTNMGLDFCDLLQEGNLGLFEAVKTFDSTKNTQFSTWAIEYIRKYITIALTEKGRVVRMNQKQIKAKNPYAHVCMDAPLSDEDGEKTLLDTFSSDVKTDSHDEVEAVKHQVACLLNGLSQRDREIVMSLFGIGCEETSMHTLAKRYGLTEERIRQIRIEAIGKMRMMAEK